ncbi:ferrous iron transport protein A [Lachnospiraceae bacterium]|jgi:ferrous iron transport protein A|nr:ferrous iron transport protein A [Lachnospiraceae bacterium]
MSLFEGLKGNNYEIRGLYVEEGITRRLQALGLNDGTLVTVLNRKKNGALIIRVRGTRLAIGNHISQGIEVEESAG